MNACLSRRQFLAASAAFAAAPAAIGSSLPAVREFRRGGMVYRRLGRTDMERVAALVRLAHRPRIQDPGQARSRAERRRPSAPRSPTGPRLRPGRQHGRHLREQRPVGTRRPGRENRAGTKYLSRFAASFRCSLARTSTARPSFTDTSTSTGSTLAPGRPSRARTLKIGTCCARPRRPESCARLASRPTAKRS